VCIGEPTTSKESSSELELEDSSSESSTVSEKSGICSSDGRNSPFSFGYSTKN